MTRPPRKRGTIYIFVLVSSMIVTMIGLMGFKMIRAQAAVALADAQRDEAAVLAESAVQWGVHLVMLKEAWREAISSGVPIRTMSFGGGEFTTTITDADGDLSDGDTDSFVIRGTGVVGTASQILEVTVSYESATHHPALDQSLTVGGNLYVDSGILTLESGGTALDQFTSGGKNLAPRVVDEANPVNVPDSSLVAAWAARGTLIPQSAHGGSIDSVTFSDTSAPFGLTPDPSGIYVIDAENNDVNISNTKVSGTLVIINLNSNRLTYSSSNVSFGDHGGPTLIVDGDLRYIADIMSMLQQGLIYVDGNVEINGEMVLVGKLLATGNVTVDSSVMFVTMNDHPSAIAGPPQGFESSPTIGIDPGSWRRVVN